MSTAFKAASIGDLRHHVAVQSRSDTQDGGGGYTSTWNTILTLWARILPYAGSEKFFAGKTTARLTHYITIRSRTDLDTSMRISWNGRVFQIHAIRIIEERKRWAQLLCEEGVAS